LKRGLDNIEEIYAEKKGGLWSCTSYTLHKTDIEKGLENSQVSTGESAGPIEGKDIATRKERKRMKKADRSIPDRRDSYTH
jgi:hypothetical protein